MVWSLNPGDGAFLDRNLVEPESGKTFSGHIPGQLEFNGSGNIAVVTCRGPGVDTNLSLRNSAGGLTSGPFNTSFACDNIVFRAVDVSDGTDDPAVTLGFVIQYDESSDVTTLT